MWESSAPSNIALIKYMGKKDGGNWGVNPSISWTLDHLRTLIQLELTQNEDRWEPHPVEPDLRLSDTGLNKFLSHLQFIKKQFGVSDRYFVIRSGNNFPSDCGIASSASSFAALTLVATQALSEIAGCSKPPVDIIADWSRRGSGSSCRSFYSGFVSWTDEGVKPVVMMGNPLLHQVAILSGAKKEVTSSQAHQRVQSSALMAGRQERAQQRYARLRERLVDPVAGWRDLFEISWAEFWDMHALFETSQPPFGYMQPASLDILNAARKFWSDKGDGPVVTMDAGPNVHFLWRADQMDLAKGWEQLRSRDRMISSWSSHVER